MNIDELIRITQRAMEGPLPGRTAQLKMASMRRIQEFLKVPVNPLATLSSVLLLFYPLGNSVGLVFILRPEYGGVHGGQISLPGGKKEEEDASCIETALRESQEEIGILPEQVKILGKLTDLYIPPSNYLVTPIIGYSSERPMFMGDPLEVERVIEVDISELLNPASVQVLKFKTRVGITFKAPCYKVNGVQIWGATAMIISEFIELIRPFIRSEA